MVKMTTSIRVARFSEFLIEWAFTELLSKGSFSCGMMHNYCIPKQTHFFNEALFTFLPNSKFLHSLHITSIFRRMHGALNVGK
jgi:hypothetical protein